MRMKVNRYIELLDRYTEGLTAAAVGLKDLKRNYDSLQMETAIESLIQKRILPTERQLETFKDKIESIF